MASIAVNLGWWAGTRREEGLVEDKIEEGWGSHSTPLHREILLGSQLENRENHYLFTVLFYSVYLFISFF